MIESGCVLDSYWYAQLTIYPGPYPGPLRCARYNLQNDVAEMEAAARHRQVRAAFDDTTIIVCALNRAICRAVQTRSDDVDQAVLSLDDVPLRMGNQAGPGARPSR